MRRRTFLAGATGVSVGLLAGCLGGSSPSDFDVGMSANAFEPREFEVSVGGTVVWANNGSRSHSVTAYESGIPADAEYFASGDFDSESAARDGYWDGEGVIDAGEQYEHTFEVPGDYEYFCVPHEGGGMVGTIVVRE
ncbi:plastocyanin/azurin family copper-binding protein [Halomarina ordinaria]|uniref:Plastocyanin/azurin family copper-binding protein n=1 Tax=Halomarina ordinaria TaxID=3033939 RepID=A0ABD5U740_9EURY|nr:plastocyanin/azurin family copper-binding protein [Halomarina sp. PSRA2]